MAWEGYYTYDGQEVANATRTETYAKNAGLSWFRPLYESDALPYMLGHGIRYTTPVLDNAPWVDPDIPESGDFYGYYPLDVTGIEDSSRTSEVIESVLDGGIGGRIRHATKEFVFNGLLIAGSDAGADYGQKWLKKVLLGEHCGVHSVNARRKPVCNGAEMTYLSAFPDMILPDTTVRMVPAVLDGGYFVLDGSNIHIVQADEPDLDGGPVLSLSDAQFSGGTPTRTGTQVEAGGVFPFTDAPQAVEQAGDGLECLIPYLRSLRRVTFNTGPTVTSKRNISSGGAAWTVTFTGRAGNPYEFGAEVPVLRGFLDPAISVPWVGGVEPEGAMLDPDGYIQAEVSCAAEEYQPIYDPLCPAVIPPPPPPSVPMGCFAPPQNWRRRQFSIPKQYVPLWGEVVPKIHVHANTSAVRNLRLRFYEAPPQGEDISSYVCDYTADLVVSYVPVGHTLTLDAAEQTVFITSPTGARQRADSLVFASDGTPFDWPAMSCGEAYVVAVDLPQTETPPAIDLSLFPRAV